MKTTIRKISARKSIALVAHDSCKQSLIQWTLQHKASLTPHTLYATGTTRHLLARESGLNIQALLSGPMGGDQQLGGLIAEKKNRYADFLLGSDERRTARSGCQSVNAYCDGLEHSGSDQRNQCQFPAQCRTIRSGNRN
ncbi:methylglyoxal synthase [Actinobacillus lignieresii]|nr:methylglyoxal synthase [Actinobacillus lignieresii]